MGEASFPLPNASTDLRGQVALVTGASSGLGRRFALTLASAGATVAAAARRLDRLEELRSEIESGDGRCFPVQLDVTDVDQIVTAITQVERALGPVTILVNNAGIPDAQRAHKIPLSLIDAVIDTNLRGPFVLSCEVARRLIASKRPGRIVNLSSMSAYEYDGNGAAALYAVTKAAVIRMTEVLAMEWLQYGINVNAIAPGLFRSEMSEGMIERIGDPSGSLPRKRMGDPAQLDSTLLYLVAPSSDFVTGAVVKVDDGQCGR